MQITIEGQIPTDARQRILAIEACVKSVCQEAGEDPADGVMVLLTAAAHLAMLHAKPGADVEGTLVVALGSAIVAADDFFKLREARS